MEEAIVLTEAAESSETGKLRGLLEFFGIAARSLLVDEVLVAVDACERSSKCRLLCTASVFMNFLTALDSGAEGRELWQSKIHSVFVYAGSEDSALSRLTAKITNLESPLSARDFAEEWVVTSAFPEFSKSMSGIRIKITAADPAAGFRLGSPGENAMSLISDGRSSPFAKFTYHNVPIFVSTASGIIDVREKLAGRDFDIRQHFLTATPPVLYIGWAFPQSCWRAPETPACLVIDDPLLKPRYGFLKFQRLLDLMRQRNFSTSIAFIPWNWRRNNKKIVRLFKENPERFSLSIHGCDHTGGEFGSLNVGRLAWKSREALQRMWRHQSSTGLPHDAVMVFPQGVFSARAMEVLKCSQFMGVVNSEVVSTDSDPLPINIGDYWGVAVLNYSDFPIFTRRYASAGIENFAFDILVGKPCLVVAHHNDCHDDCRHVAEFMDRLNQLNVPLRWTNLADVIRRSFRQRETSDGVVEVEMYGSEIQIVNTSTHKTMYRFSKRESALDQVKDVRAAGNPVRWEIASGRQGLAFEIELNPGESRIVSVLFREPVAANDFEGENLRYKVKAMARRFLSEMRDNYVTRKSFST